MSRNRKVPKKAVPPGQPPERQAFLEAVAQGLADVRAGRVIDDEALGEHLDAEFGPLEPDQES